MSGFSIGKERSVEKHGVNIEAQVDRLLENFERDPKDGAVSTTEDGFPEYLYKYEDKNPYSSDAPETKWASIEKFVRSADSNGDTKATRQEMVDKLKSFDENGNGLLSWNDASRLNGAGFESIILDESLPEPSPR